MASKKKKIVSKEELRRLMKEKKTSVSTSVKKIDHPFAKYSHNFKLYHYFLYKCLKYMLNTVSMGKFDWLFDKQSST